MRLDNGAKPIISAHKANISFEERGRRHGLWWSCVQEDLVNGSCRGENTKVERGSP